MLAISARDFRNYGCPNCGCEDATAGNISGYGTSFATCENCKLEFIILANGVDKSAFGISVKNNTETEYPPLINHPREGRSKWKYKWPDPRPEEGEFFSPRGVGYDLAGFVKSKEGGERIIELVKDILGSDNIKTWLDYRPHEPKWIQVKFQKEEFNLEKLDELTQDGIITREKLIQCKK